MGSFIKHVKVNRENGGEGRVNERDSDCNKIVCQVLWLMTSKNCRVLLGVRVFPKSDFN